MLAVWESFKHRCGVKIPQRPLRHHIQSERTEDAKIDRCVELLHESRLFCPSVDASTDCKGPDHTLHEEFAGEGEDDGVECHKADIVFSFAEHVTATGDIRAQRVGEEDGMMKRIFRPGVNGV
jgi:hypothetical protein